MGILKIINLKWFVEKFSKYDIITKRIKLYGYMYPFFEITLGIFYFLHFQTFKISIFALIISGITLIGLFRAIIKKQHGDCVCLGKVVKLKIGWLSFFENITMVLMAIRMIIAMRPKSETIPFRMQGQSQQTIKEHCKLMPSMPGCEKYNSK